MSRWWRRRTRGVAGEKAVKIPHKQGGAGHPRAEPTRSPPGCFIKQTYVHIARYGEGRGVRMGAAVAAETEAGVAGKKAVELPQPGAAHRHAFHPLLGDKGGEGGNKRLAPSHR